MILGLLQGFTEFLPISSSGHLVLMQRFIEVQGDDLAFDLVLHIGTLIPVLVLFREDLIRMVRDPLTGSGPWLARPGVRWLLFVVLASVPTAIMGLLLEDLFESMFSGPLSLAWQFAVTAALLGATAKLGTGTRDLEDMTWKDALILGIAQGISILPAVSRSGTTIAVAMFLGLRRDLAGRFSFVMSIPAIAGAMALKLDDVTVDPEVLPNWIIGGVASLIAGWVSLVFLIRVIKAGDFSKFAWYCWGMAALSLGIGLFIG